MLGADTESLAATTLEYRGTTMCPPILGLGWLGPAVAIGCIAYDVEWERIRPCFALGEGPGVEKPGRHEIPSPAGSHELEVGRHARAAHRPQVGRAVSVAPDETNLDVIIEVGNARDAQEAGLRMPMLRKPLKPRTSNVHR